MKIFRNLKQFFINLYKWRKILWNDRNWDYAFVLDILEFKLTDLRNGLMKWNNSSNNPKSVEEINKTLSILKAYKNGNFGCEYQEYIKTIWKSVPVEGKPDLFINVSEVVENNSIIYINQHKAMVRKMVIESKKGTFFIPYKKETSDTYTAFTLSRYRQERAKRLLYKMLEYKLEGWWD